MLTFHLETSARLRRDVSKTRGTWQPQPGQHVSPYISQIHSSIFVCMEHNETSPFERSAESDLRLFRTASERSQLGNHFVHPQGFSKHDFRQPFCRRRELTCHEEESLEAYLGEDMARIGSDGLLYGERTITWSITLCI